MNKNTKIQTKNALNKFIDKLKTLSILQKLAAAGILLVIIYLIFTGSKSEADAAYKTETVKYGNIVDIVSETGEISTSAKTDVASTITGIVNDVYVENGDEVVRGQSLFSVTSTATQEERATAYSTYQTAASALNIANSNYRSKQATADKVLDELSGHDDDETLAQKETRTIAEVARDSAYDSLKSAEATLSKASLIYQATIDGTVKSTANGTVVNLAIAQGQNVDGSTNALVIESESATWIKLAVNETDISTVKSGQKATVSVDALKDVEFAGKVERVDSIGTVTSGIVTYNVYVLLSEPNQNIKPGMTAQVDIQTQKKEDILVVSNSAIKPYQGGRAVQILDDNTGELIYLPIKVGIVGPTKSEIVSGLEEGQEIIISQTDSSSKNPGSSSLIRVPGTK
jgi:RND family efflux transporter MFP subunit